MLERLAQYDRWAVTLCLAAVIVLCWGYLLNGAGTLQEMGGMLMPMTVWPWNIEHALLMLGMWMVMMAAMMLPSAAPVILLYSAIIRRRSAARPAAAGTALFGAGYLTVWSAFSLIAVLLQFLLEWAALLSPMMEATSNVLSGLILLIAGVYQLTPSKQACLHHCRSPLEFLTVYWRSGNSGAFAIGLRHGAYCLGCCWGLMLLLFVGGLMNFAWIAGLALYVLAEKLAPGGQWISRIAAAALMLAGVAVLSGALSAPLQ